jgi:hypothetical protein
VVKRPGRKADHSPPSSAEVKARVALYLHSRNTPAWRGAQLKHRNTLSFTFKFKTLFFDIDEIVRFKFVPQRQIVNQLFYAVILFCVQKDVWRIRP